MWNFFLFLLKTDVQLILNQEVVFCKKPSRRFQVVNSRDFLAGDEWTPLIVIGNRKSGSKDTSTILANFRTQLNPAQVIIQLRTQTYDEH